MDERALGDIATVDSTPTVTPEDFSFEDFLNGVRPTRRSVMLYPRGDLIARMDEIVALIERADDDENVDDLADEFERVKADYYGSGVWFTLEKRASTWAEHFRVETEKKLGMKRTKGEDGVSALSPEDAAQISIHQLAEQIVIPSGVTVAQLQRLFEANEGEFNKLVFTMIKVNGELAQDATDQGRERVLTKDFSQRRSGNR